MYRIGLLCATINGYLFIAFDYFDFPQLNIAIHFKSDGQIVYIVDNAVNGVNVNFL